MAALSDGGAARDPAAVAGDDTAAADQVVDGFVGLAEIVRDGLDLGLGAPQPPARRVSGLG